MLRQDSPYWRDPEPGDCPDHWGPDCENCEGDGWVYLSDVEYAPNPWASESD